MTGARARGGRPGSALAGFGALAALIVTVAGVPAALIMLGGDPLPHHIPAWHTVMAVLLRRDDTGALFLGAVRDVTWVAWAAFSAAVAAEVQAALRGQRAPRLRLGGLQNAAGWLVALTMIGFAGQPAAALALTAQAAPAAAAPLQAGPAAVVPAAVVPEPAAPVPGPPSAQLLSTASGQLVTVQPGDCLWTIAQRRLGNGDLYPQIARLNLGHDMGGGAVFSDPSLIWPGWVLQLPASTAGAPAAAPAPPAMPVTPGPAAPQGPVPGPAAGGGGQHPGHPAASPAFSQPHPAASPAQPGGNRARSSQPVVLPEGIPAGPPAATPAPASRPATGQQPGAGPRPAAAGPAAAPAAQTTGSPGQEVPALGAFGAGVLVGGAGVALARMRRRQRQARRPGRRIPMPASAPVIAVEQQLRAAAGQQAGLAVPGPGADWLETTAWPLPDRPERLPQPATALRAALSQLGASLSAAGRPLPQATAVRVHRSQLELMLAGPSAGPPPAPFSEVDQPDGLSWRLDLDGYAPPAAGQAGDLLPGLVTAGITSDGGYLLINTEQLGVTTVDGPDDLAGLVLATAAAELTTSQLAGWYDLVLAGFDELGVVDGRATICASLDEALDLIAARAVTQQRRLGSADVRQRRIDEPADEDWALTLLVSRTPPEPAQLAMLLDLAEAPGGIAALVAGGTVPPAGHRPPASLRLRRDPDLPGGISGYVWPADLEVCPQPLSRDDYEALTTLFATAADQRDVPAAEPPYDGSCWPPEPLLDGLQEPPGEPSPDEAHGEPVPGELPPGELLAGPVSGEAPGEPAPGELPPEEPAPGVAGTATGQEPGEALPGDPLPGQPASGAPGTAAPGGAVPGEPPPGSFAETPGEPASGTVGADLPGLRIGVMGTFTVNGSPAALQPAQAQLILALALNGSDGLSNAQLCYLLGPGPDHPKPSDSLRQLIVRTRRQLGRNPDGREWIEHLGAGQYALHPQARFDWADFEDLSEHGMAIRDRGALRQALGLIRGRPFTGCYHWWLDVAFTESVRAQIVDTAELLAELDLAAGDPSAAARAARTALAADPAAEQLWRAVMRAEHAAGNRAGVREAWSRCLDAITDIAADGEPHPDTTALYQQLTGTARVPSGWAGEAASLPLR